MRNLSFLTLLLIGCSSPHYWPQNRSLASLSEQSRLRFELKLSYPLIFANGANAQVLAIEIFDARGEKLKINPADLELHTDAPVLDEKKFANGDGIQITFRPAVKSPDLKLMVSWKDQFSEIIEVKTTLNPLKEKLLPLPSDASSMSYVAGLTYLTHDNFLPHQYEGFSVSNDGKNAIVTNDESGRDFDFEFLEQARQNISLMVSDAPNGTVSHTMHSHFMFFPRLHLPFAEVSEDKTTVTLPTGEKMVFSKEGEIIDGVFKEGPVDVGPDRFKRQYADLKYQGKGIVLRANARGQMPQQGQFENTPIDLDYGIKYSNDVLIINGSTGQRCRRPKKDFWLSADVSPIQFKFPTDAEFDAYLKQNCKFGIPELSPVLSSKKKDVSDDVSSIWQRCEDKSDVKECLEEESRVIENLREQKQIRFALTLKLNQARKEEQERMPELIDKEARRIQQLLKNDVSWIKNAGTDQVILDCQKTGLGQVNNPLRFQDARENLEVSLKQICADIVPALLASAADETIFFKDLILSDFSWVKDNDKLESHCMNYGLSLMNQGKRFSHFPAIYRPSLKKICDSVPASDPYKTWLASQKGAIESRISLMVMDLVEAKAEARARSCLEKFPANTQMNRLLYKKDREACLINAWDSFEREALAQAAADPMVKLVNLPLTSIEEKLVMERRRTQLKIMKKYFL